MTAPQRISNIWIWDIRTWHSGGRGSRRRATPCRPPSRCVPKAAFRKHWIFLSGLGRPPNRRLRVARGSSRRAGTIRGRSRQLLHRHRVRARQPLRADAPGFLPAPSGTLGRSRRSVSDGAARRSAPRPDPPGAGGLSSAFEPAGTGAELLRPMLVGCGAAPGCVRKGRRAATAAAFR